MIARGGKRENGGAVGNGERGGATIKPPEGKLEGQRCQEGEQE